MTERGFFNSNSRLDNLDRGAKVRSEMIARNLGVWISPEELPVDIPKNWARGLVLALGSVTLAVAAIACGKVEAERKNNQTPTPTETPVATRTVEPTPTETLTPELKGLPETAPAQVKEFYARVDTIASKFHHPDAVSNFKKSLAEATTVNNPDSWRKANAEFRSYRSAFGGLVGAYYATANPEILQLAKDLKIFVVANYPDQYQQDLNSSPQVWEVKEREK